MTALYVPVAAVVRQPQLPAVGLGAELEQAERGQPRQDGDGDDNLIRVGRQIAKFDPFLSLDCARVEGVGAQSKERKGSNFAAQRSGAIVQKPEGPNTYVPKIWL